MTRQNRVTPFGEVVAEPARGTMFGNRGSIHDADGRIVRRASVTRWICCVLEFKGRRRSPLMQPGRYTELFFLDEATALAAGHRPCAECRRAGYDRFRDAWAVAHGGGRPSAAEMDAVLDPQRRAAPAEAKVATLPDGAMVDLDGSAHLVLGGQLLPWSFTGYGEPAPAPRDPIPVLTRRAIVNTIAAGYAPQMHDDGRLLRVARVPQPQRHRLTDPAANPRQ